ncbi:MAG: hypothetical protein IT204_17745 [Fimbriimonadaceae bacterium]|nr:hypothetical protein [Fimbriimonadaceae bacterium]
MAARSSWRWLGLLAVGVLATVYASRGRQPSPQDAVHAQIQQFVEGVENRELAAATRVLGPGFTWDQHSRGDVIRGIYQVCRQWDQLSLYLDRTELTVAPDGRTVTARLLVSAQAHQGGRDIALGTDRLIPVTVVFQRHGRRWLAKSAQSTGQLDSLAF